MAMGAVELRAEPADAKKDTPSGPPVPCAVIGLGEQGRAILTSLAKLGAAKAPVAAICDKFKTPVFMKKSLAITPDAAFQDDYRKVLDDKKIQAVFVATPSHLHKQIVLDALQAGKHVYCEAPLANDLTEAKDIAKAGMAAKTFLVPGLQVRSNAQANHVHHFVKAHDTGDIIQGRGQWHLRTSWRIPYPTPERENELNWRLNKETSTGLIGEVGIHQIDTATRYLNSLPIAVTGFSGIIGWKDGRTVPDSAQCVIEYPNNIFYYYDASLISNFEGSYDVFYGTEATILMRDQRAWMFKEPDARVKGWEGFARRDVIAAGNPDNGTGEKIGTGIALVADATKQLALGKDPSKVGTDVSKTSLYQALDAFITSVSTNKKPEYGPLEGYQATVIAHKCNDAAVSRSRIVFEPDWLTL